MASSLFQNPNQNNPMQMIQQFNQFKQSLQGRNPDAILKQMIESGQVSQSQVEQATQMARQFQSLLRP